MSMAVPLPFTVRRSPQMVTSQSPNQAWTLPTKSNDFPATVIYTTPPDFTDFDTGMHRGDVYSLPPSSPANLHVENHDLDLWNEATSARQDIHKDSQVAPYPPRVDSSQQSPPGLFYNSRHTSPTASEASSVYSVNRSRIGIDHVHGGPSSLAVHMRVAAPYTVLAQHPWLFPGQVPYNAASASPYASVALQDVLPSQHGEAQGHGGSFDFEPGFHVGTSYGQAGMISALRTHGTDEDLSDDIDPNDMDVDTHHGAQDEDADEGGESDASSTMDAEGEEASDLDYTPTVEKAARGSATSARARSSRPVTHSRTNSKSTQSDDDDEGTRDDNGSASLRSKHSRIKNKKRQPPQEIRPFPCPLATYGCLESFSTKNEWKRHINTQHVPTTIWRCSLCCSRSLAVARPYRQKHYDFKRKDLLIMHLKRKHADQCVRDAPQQAMSASIGSTKTRGKRSANGKKVTKAKDSSLTKTLCNTQADRSLTNIREPPGRVECILCEKVFDHAEAWDAWIEHIAVQHFEKLKKDGLAVPRMEDWHIDAWLEQWLEDENIIESTNSSWRFVNGSN